MHQAYLWKIEWLFGKLKEDKFIANDTELEVFINAFNGSDFEHRKLISWTVGSTNSTSSKPLLISFINELIRLEIIEDVKYPKNFILNLFSNADGSRIKEGSLQSMNSQMKHRKKNNTILSTNLKDILASFKTQNVT